MAVSKQEHPIRLLHLSDFHFREGKAWDSEPVLRFLARFIGKQARAGLQPDLVVITGDLAFSGRKSEYKLAVEWLERQLWPALGGKLTRDRVLLVPGNHDVDRAKVTRGVKYTQRGLLSDKSQDGIAEVLGDQEERRGLLARHAQYLAFLTDWSGGEQALPWWQRSLEIRGHRLHLAGLDSAWMACADEDRNRLLLGRWQLNQTLITAEAEAADLRIALLHHPWDYLAEFDGGEARRSIHQHADLVLRGHLHEPEAARYVAPDPGRSCLELAAGCVYEHSRYPNAFQWVELWPVARKARVHFRLWRDGEWIVDLNQPGCPEGWAEFDLAGQGRAPDLAVPRKPMVPAEYLTWLRERYASVELLGYDQQQGRAITLDHVYVPAVTRPVRESEREGPGTGREEEPKPTLLLDRLRSESLYVPGPPGAGKSTFSRWAVLLAGPGVPREHPVPAPEGYREPEPGGLRGRLPLLVPLRELGKTMDCGRGRRTWSGAELEQALAAWVDGRRPAGLDGRLLRDHLAAGSAFLVLDGLDEVPVSEPRGGHTDYPRAVLLSGLADALPAWEQAGNRTLLTSRPYGLDEAELRRLGLARAPLEPLPDKLQALFIGRWFHALGQSELGEGLLEDIRGREDLAPLVENPMLLTALCVIYGNGQRLPQDRYHLYQRIVDNVLYNRYPGDARQREPIKARLEAVAHGMHSGSEVGEARQAPAAEVGQSGRVGIAHPSTAFHCIREHGGHKHRAHPTVSFAELLVSAITDSVTTPIQRVYSGCNVSVERGIRPIPYSADMAVLDRIPMDVVDVTVEIVLVADLMLPKAPLPDGAFPVFVLGWGDPLGATKQISCLLRKPGFDQTPSL